MVNLFVSSISIDELMYGAQLKRNGTPIPENDIWIASTAMAGNLTLVTADSDFNAVENLSLEMM